MNYKKYDFFILITNINKTKFLFNVSKRIFLIEIFIQNTFWYIENNILNKVLLCTFNLFTLSVYSFFHILFTEVFNYEYVCYTVLEVSLTGAALLPKCQHFVDSLTRHSVYSCHRHFVHFIAFTSSNWL